MLRPRKFGTRNGGWLPPAEVTVVAHLPLTATTVSKMFLNRKMGSAISTSGKPRSGASQWLISPTRSSPSSRSAVRSPTPHPRANCTFSGMASRSPKLLKQTLERKFPPKRQLRPRRSQQPALRVPSRLGFSILATRQIHGQLRHLMELRASSPTMDAI